MGFSVLLCGCHEACRAYSNMQNDSGDEGNNKTGSMLTLKYGIAMVLSAVFFLWGMVEWFRLSDACIADYDNKYQGLIILFRASVLVDAVILLVSAAIFIIMGRAGDKKGSAQGGP